MNRPLVKAAIVIAVILGGLLAYHYREANRTPQEYYAAGKKYYDQKKYPEAIVQFLNSVDQAPGNRDTRYYLALSYLNHDEIPEATKQLIAVLEANPNDKEANLQLGNIYIALGKTDPEFYHRAQKLAETLLYKDPESVAALVLAGNSAIGLRDFDTSVELLERAITVDPKNSGAFLSLGASQTLQRHLPEAEKAFLNARDANPKDIGALITLGNYYRSVGDPIKAEAVFKDALSQYPGERTVYTQVVEFYSQTGRPEEVERILRDAQARRADDPTPTMTLASFYESRNRAPEARKLLLDLEPKFSANTELAVRLATNLMTDQPAQAKQEIDKILKNEPKNPIGYVLLGELQFRTGQFEAAQATLGREPALDSPFPQVHYLLGNLAAREKRLDEAQDHYQKALVLNSRYSPAQVALADVFRAKGKLADAREQNQAVLAVQPGNVTALLLEATIDVADKKFPEAERILTALEKDHPASSTIEHELGLYYESRDNAADAETRLAHAVELSPSSELNLRDLITFYLKTKQLDRAMQQLNKVPDGQKQAFHYEFRGMIGVQMGKPQDAENDFRKALEKDPNRTSSQMLLFNQYVQSGRVDVALKQLEDLSRKNPANPGVNAMKGTIQEGKGQLKEAEQSYRRALDVDPTVDYAANNLAYILAEDGRDLQDALGMAQGVRERQPQDPNAADTLGWVYYKLGNYGLALKQAEFAVSKQPENGLWQYHIGLIYKENHQLAEAAAALKKAIASPQDFKEKKLAQSTLCVFRQCK